MCEVFVQRASIVISQMNKQTSREETLEHKVECILHIPLYMIIVGEIKQSATSNHVMIELSFDAPFEGGTVLTHAFPRFDSEAGRIHVVVNDELQVVRKWGELYRCLETFFIVFILIRHT